MAESYRDYPADDSAEDRCRLERLTAEVETLRTEVRIYRMKTEIARLRAAVAEVQSLRQAEAGVMKFLRTQTESIDKGDIRGAKRMLLLKALRRLVQNG